jgi:GNAT superfamily N-acetyltransferase
MPHLERRDLSTWSDSDWARCYVLHLRAHREQGTTARSLDAYRAAQLAAANAQAGARSWIVREGDDIVGNLALTLSTAVPGLAVLNLYVHPDARQRGVGRALVAAAMRDAQSEGAHLVEVTMMQPDSWRLCERLGGRLERGGTNLTLRLANTNWHLVDAWCERGLQGSLLTSLREIEQLPDAIAGGFIELHNRVWADQPHAEHAGPPLTLDDRRAQELSYERLGWRWVTLVSSESSGVLSGMTDILYDPSQPDIIRQNFTGTRPGYRGRGLAKWLKASMLQLVRERFPAAQQIATMNAQSNAAMLAINRQLGFDAAIQYRTYRFDLGHLREALERSERRAS